MLHINNLKNGLDIFKALASDIRIEILELISKEGALNMNEIAESLKLSNSAITMHVKKLEECGLITVNASSGKHGNQKICSLVEDKLLVDIVKAGEDLNSYESEVGTGLYSNFEIQPTCGLATKDTVIGEFDDPRYFADPRRVNASILWFSKGYIEYPLPNYLKVGQVPVEVMVSMELGSEAPGACDNWPSDIYFYINGIELGYWTCPGDFGDVKGRFTPSWWLHNVNSYGLLKHLTINKNGSFIDGNKISDVTIADLKLNYRSSISLRLAIPDKSKNIGGLTIFGNNFGNYNQDIRVKISYTHQGENL